jgi:AcrR family transcriptional regulator
MTDITIEHLSKIGKDGKTSAKLLEIAKAAATLFFEKGYVHTTTRDIAKACNMSPGHLYYYIRSKDDFPIMFAEIHQADIDLWEKTIRQQMATVSPERLLERAVWEYAHLIALRRKMVLFWYTEASYISVEPVKAVSKVDKQAIHLFKDIVDLGIGVGQFQTADSFISGLTIMMMCSTWSLKRWLLKANYSIDQYADLCVKQVVPMVHGKLSRDYDTATSA